MSEKNDIQITISGKSGAGKTTVLAVIRRALINYLRANVTYEDGIVVYEDCFVPTCPDLIIQNLKAFHENGGTLREINIHIQTQDLAKCDG